MSKILNEFKEFAVKGNAVDMAVGVIIGGAFGKIVSSTRRMAHWGCQLQRLEIHIACGGDSRCGEHDGCHHQLR